MQFNVRKPKIFIVGTGGTGGFVIDHLARLIANEDIQIHLIDGDVVEHKNLTRQSFTVEDLGVRKAEAKKAHIDRTFGQSENVQTKIAYVSDADEFLMYVLDNVEADETPIIVSAVDNVATRRIINQTIGDYPSLAIGIDSGNHDTGGQVVLFANRPVTVSDLLSKWEGLLPTMLELYPEMNNVEDVVPGEGTACEEHAESDPQSMMANVLNAVVIATLIQNIIANHEITHNLWLTDASTGQINACLKLS